MAFPLTLAAVREWIGAHTCQPEETTEARKDEADINLDTALRIESRIRLDQEIESIEATSNGVWIELNDGEVLSIRADDGFIFRGLAED